MNDSEMNNRYLDFKIDFKTAKELNNDLIDLVNALSDLEMRTAIGKRIRDNFQEPVEKSLEIMEDSVILVLSKEMEW
jgi:hypothetical protein